MSNLNDQLGAELDKLARRASYRSLRTIASAQGVAHRARWARAAQLLQQRLPGLANDTALKQAAVEAIEKYGVGAGASRLVCGNLQPYEDLERKLAAFKAKEAAIVFGSGYAANVGTITALVGEGDMVILDKLGSCQYYRWRAAERRDPPCVSAQESQETGSAFSSRAKLFADG